MAFDPRIDARTSDDGLFDRSNKGDQHQCERDRGCECAKKGKPVSGPNNEVGQHERPTLEDQHVKKTVERTRPLRLSAKIEKSSLKREARQDRKEINPSRPETSRPESVERVAETRQEAKRRRNEQKAVHGF